MSDVVLKVNGQNFSGWETVEVNRSMTSLSGSFNLTVSNKWAPDLSKWPIKIGAECQVLLNDEIVITGYIDVINSSFDSNSHVIQIAGRDKAGDLIDCSVVNVDQLSNTPVINICKELCKPFGIDVIDGIGLNRSVPVFKVQPSETVFEAMSRTIQKEGALLVSNGKGSIEIIRSGSERAASALTQSVSDPGRNNIKSANASVNAYSRFSEYTVKSQLGGSWEQLAQNDSMSIRGNANDESVTRFRPYIILAETQSSKQEADNRAKWEATNRAAKSSQISCMVDGWTGQNGELWQPNRIVRFKSDYLSIDRDLLISEVKFSLDFKNGSQTNLTLTRPDAFIPQQSKKTDMELWEALSKN